MQIIGEPLDRIDGRAKVTGAAKYSAEWSPPGLIYAALVTATIAAGKIDSMDLSLAKKSPGVIEIFTHENFPKINTAGGGGAAGKIVMVLQDALIRYDNQPIGVVLADTLERAEEAAGLVKVRYSTEVPKLVLTPNAPGITPPKTKTPLGEDQDIHVGDAVKALGNSDITHRLEENYSIPIETHNPMEPHATVAIWEGKDRLTLYDSTQGVHTSRKRFADLFGIPLQNVRVICLYLGGGFGCKGPVWSHGILAAACARLLAKPVKIVLSRMQMFNNTGFRPCTFQKISLGAKKDNSLEAIRHQTITITSVYDEWLERAGSATGMLYNSPNIEATHLLIPVSVGTPSYMRAPGEASGQYALECALDELAYAQQIDPVQLRLKIYATKSPESGKPFSQKNLQKCYLRGVELIGWDTRNPKPGAMFSADGRYATGFGMATATYPGNRMASNALVRILPSGPVQVRAGTQDLGTGTYTVMAQIAAQALAVTLDQIDFKLGDTDYPVTPVSGGSWTAASTGGAILAAANNAKKQLIDIAAKSDKSPFKGAKDSDLDLFNGSVVSRTDPNTKVSFSDVVAFSNQPQIEVKGNYTPPDEEQTPVSIHSFGAQFAKVRIDRELGIVRVTDWVGVFDPARILNAKTAKSQLLGGVVFGIGMALTEATIYDPTDARLVNNNLAEYHLPVNADVPNIQIEIVPSVDDYMPVGGRGIGEIGVTGAPAAIANAVYHATGKRVRDLPITLDKLI